MRGYFTRNSGLGGKDVRAITWRLEGEKRERAGRKLEGETPRNLSGNAFFPFFHPVSCREEIYNALSLLSLFTPTLARAPARVYARA